MVSAYLVSRSGRTRSGCWDSFCGTETWVFILMNFNFRDDGFWELLEFGDDEEILDLVLFV